LKTVILATPQLAVTMPQLAVTVPQLAVTMPQLAVTIPQLAVTMPQQAPFTFCPVYQIGQTTRIMCHFSFATAQPIYIQSVKLVL
jgi:hypothetical protein